MVLDDALPPSSLSLSLPLPLSPLSLHAPPSSPSPFPPLSVPPCLQLNIMKAEAFVRQQTKAVNVRKKAQQRQMTRAAEGAADTTAEGGEPLSDESTHAALEALEKEMAAAKNKRRKLRALKAVEEEDGVGMGKKQKEKIKLLASIMAQQLEKWDQDKAAQVRGVTVAMVDEGKEGAR